MGTAKVIDAAPESNRTVVVVGVMRLSRAGAVNSTTTTGGPPAAATRMTTVATTIRKRKERKRLDLVGGVQGRKPSGIFSVEPWSPLRSQGVAHWRNNRVSDSGSRNAPRSSTRPPSPPTRRRRRYRNG